MYRNKRKRTVQTEVRFHRREEEIYRRCITGEDREDHTLGGTDKEKMSIQRNQHKHEPNRMNALLLLL